MNHQDLKVSHLSHLNKIKSKKYKRFSTPYFENYKF